MYTCASTYRATPTISNDTSWYTNDLHFISINSIVGSALELLLPVRHNDGSVVQRLPQRIVSSRQRRIVLRSRPQYRKLLLDVLVDG